MPVQPYNYLGIFQDFYNFMKKEGGQLVPFLNHSLQCIS